MACLLNQIITSGQLDALYKRPATWPLLTGGGLTDGRLAHVHALNTIIKNQRIYNINEVYLQTTIINTDMKV